MIIESQGSAERSQGNGAHFSSNSESFRRTMATVEQFARFERATLLLEGEAGTGKTTLARYIHTRSPRSAQVFHRVDLATMDDGLSGSDLFGHVAGSFTGANARRQGHLVSANRGTLFLDEIGKASLAVQRRLLHIIEYGEFTAVGADRPIHIDVRIVAATNVSLERLVERGDFLPDLLPRLGLFRIVVPPLRERRADIPALVAHTIRARAAFFGYRGTAPSVHSELLEALVSAPWLGNVRELVAALDYLLVKACGESELTLLHCVGPLESLAVGRTEGERIRDVVRATGSISAAARKLGVARTTVYRHLGQADGASAPGERNASA